MINITEPVRPGGLICASCGAPSWKKIIIGDEQHTNGTYLCLDCFYDLMKQMLQTWSKAADHVLNDKP